MISADRDALICDLAEVYGVFDYRALPVPLLATLGTPLTKVEMLAAAAVDRLSLLVWMNSEDGRKGENRPGSILSVLLGEESDESPLDAFETAEEFEAEWTKRTGVSHGR